MPISVCHMDPLLSEHGLHGVYQDVVGRHVLKVEPLNAILDPHYFVRAVHGCVLAVLAQRAQRAQQRGGPSSALDARWVH